MESPEEILSDYIVKKSGWDDNAHTRKFGCTVTASNVVVGTDGDGCCEMCYSEYAAIFYDLECTCPAQVPQKKNPEKMTANTNRVNFKRASFSAYDFPLLDLVNHVLRT